MKMTGYLLSIRAVWDDGHDWTPRTVFVGKNARERAEDKADKERNHPSNQNNYRFTVDEIEVEFENDEAETLRNLPEHKDH